MRTFDDGSKEYTYDVEGHELTYLVPPAGFNFATASDEELDRYHVPRRPPGSDPTNRALWDKAIPKLTFVTPPDNVLALPDMHATVNSSNWSGLIDHTYGPFTDAAVQYNEPAPIFTACAENAAVFFAGIGGWAHNALGQDGTILHGVNNADEHQGWWEVYPDLPIMPIQLHATQGSGFKAVTHWTGSGYTFSMANLATNQTQVVNYSTSTYDGDTAEYIAERPTRGTTVLPLTDFGSWSPSQATSDGIEAGTWPHSGINMVVAGHGLAQSTGDNPTSTGGFNDLWKNCS